MELVWQPSAETQNPYYPLWRVQGKVREVEEIRILGYMDIKGNVHKAFSEAPLKGGGL